MKKKNYIILMLLFVLSLGVRSLALADDDENEYGDDEHQVQQQAPVPSSSSSKSSKPKTVTQTIVTPPTYITRTILKDVTLPDADKDGLPDSEDPHPTIAEIYIVQDVNNDGIDDQYEILPQ